MSQRFIFVAAFALFLSAGAMFAIHAPTFAQEVSSSECPGLSASECSDLKAQYDELQKEIAGLNTVIRDTQAKKGTLQGDVSALNAQIKQAEAQIRAKNLAITRIGGEINQKTSHINELSSRIESGKESLASFIRRQDQIDDLSLPEVLIGADTAFALFADVDNMVTVQAGLYEEFAQIRTARTETEAERTALAAREAAEQDARYDVETKKQQVARNQAEKQTLLNITANQEAQYQAVLADRQAKAAAIRARLFPLRDTGTIAFGDAVRYAQAASAKTGVRAAMILAILSQESDLGSNVGNCLVTSIETGDGKGKNTGTVFLGVMKAPRDTVPFKRITEALGKDWATTPVSCPQPGGYGGAMGPTQFIPSTWVMFEARIKTALGVAATNPWNAEHAIMATALYLSDVGAGAGGYTAESNAACRYYSGGACSGGAISAYGSSVVAKANAFQKDIDFLKEN